MKLDSERQTSYDITYMWNLKGKKKDTNECICRTETDSDFGNKLMVTKGDRWVGEGMDWGFGGWNMHIEAYGMIG